MCPLPETSNSVKRTSVGRVFKFFNNGRFQIWKSSEWKGPPVSSYPKSLKEQAKNGGGFSLGGGGAAGRGGDFYYPPNSEANLGSPL
jgi:hypothetical protein